MPHLARSLAQHSLKAVCTLAATLLAGSAQAQFTYTGGTLNANQTYDGFGVDKALNPWTVGSVGNLPDDYIGNNGGGFGSLTVLSGSLTFNDDDFKVGDTYGFGTLNVGSGATLNINNIGQWSGALGYNGGVGTLNISNNAVLNWTLAGTQQQELLVGCYNESVGTINLNGGSLNVILGTTNLTDQYCQFSIGGPVGSTSPESYGTVNLNSGTLNDEMPLPLTLGGSYGGLPAAPAFSSSPKTSVINIDNGTLIMTGIYSNTDPSKATLTINPGSYVNFIPGGTGSLSLTNWAASDYFALVSAGQIYVDGAPTTPGNLIYTNVNGQGILQVGSFLVADATVEPGTIVDAQTPVTLSATVFGTASSLQWQTDNGTGGATWANIPGATATSYVTNTASLSGTYEYQLIAISPGESVTSAVVSVMVNPASAPTLFTDITPVGTNTVYVGTAFSLSVALTGTLPMTNQWQVSSNDVTWAEIANATNATLTFTNLATANIGFYRLVAANALGSVTSSVCDLVIKTNPKFVWSAPVPIDGLNADQILTNFPGTKIASAMFCESGNAITVTLSSGATIAFGPVGVWDNVTGGDGFNNNAGAPSTVDNANFSAVLGDFYYDGANHYLSLNNLVVGQEYSVQLFSEDERNLSPPTSQRLVNWQNPADQFDYSATISMASNAYIVGTFYASNTTEELQENMDDTNQTGNFNGMVLRAVGWNPPPYLAQNPNSPTAYQGNSTTLTGLAGGDNTLVYQWLSGPSGGPYTNLLNGSKYAGVTNTSLTISNLTADDAAIVYGFVATSDGGSVTSAVASVTVVVAPTPALVGHWLTGGTNFDETSGYQPAHTHDGFALDTISGGNHDWTNDVPYGTGYSLYLTNTGVTITNSSNLDNDYVSTFDDTIQYGFSVTFWAKPLPPGTWNPWLSKYGENNLGWQLRNGSSSDEVCWTVRDGSAGTFTLGSGPDWDQGGDQDDMHAAITITDQKWHFYAGTFDGVAGIRNLYIDGVLRGQEIGNVPYFLTPSSHVCIGAKDSGGNAYGNYYTGQIYDVRIYDYALSQSQVRGVGPLAPPSATEQFIRGSAANGHTNQVVLSWSWGSLYEATNVLGPWTKLAATSPYTNAASLAQQYFKVGSQ